MIYVWFTLLGIEQHRFVVCICISEFVLYLPVYGSGVSENGANPTIVILIKKIMINYNYKDLEPPSFIQTHTVVGDSGCLV